MDPISIMAVANPMKEGSAIESGGGLTSIPHGRRRIALDLTALLPHETGVDRYMIQLVLYLGKIDQWNHYRIYVNWEDRNRFVGLLPENFRVIPLSRRSRAVRLLFQQVLLPTLVGWWEADVVHSPSFIMPMVRGSQYHILTVHDMTSFTLPKCHILLRRSFPYRQVLLWSIRRAHLITVPSGSTQKDMYRWVPDLSRKRVRVIPGGIGEEFQVYPRQAIQNTLERLGISASYILYVGTIEPRKNLPLLVQSYKQLVTMGKTKEHLVLVGRLGWGYDAVLKQIESPELKHRVHLVGYVHQHDLPLVYAGATLFVYPSLQEGFGFPPLEAMACGVPTISSQTSSLIENLQGAAILVPPDDQESLTNAIDQLLNDKACRDRYRQEGFARAAAFRWEDTARRTLQCYQEVSGSYSPKTRDS
ncbi:MAG: glycosyltransferase family 4 protein [Nitrospirales bacterium]|nr:glycosyltransferase family 4 protein [Nitrospirales bacterium]